MKLQVAIDLDDVQANLFDTLRLILNEHTGIHKDASDYTTFEFSELYPGFENGELLKAMREQKALERCKPLSGAAEATELLSIMGYEINVVTARGWHDDARNASIDWLERYGFTFDRLLISRHGESKSALCKKVASKFELFVDDYIGNINDAIESSLFNDVLLVDKPWNATDQRFVFGGNRFLSLFDAVNSHYQRHQAA